MFIFRYSAKSKSIEHKCSCCRETETEIVTIELGCPNGNIINYSFVDIKKCSCAVCSKEEEDGEASYVTNAIPQTTVKVKKATKPTKDSKGQQTESKESGSESIENEEPDTSSEETNKSKPISQPGGRQVTKQVPQSTKKGPNTSKKSTEILKKSNMPGNGK